MTAAPQLPVVLACAGCSFVAHLSWRLAKALDTQGLAQMSCLAGVAARRPAFVRIPEQRQTWVIDGCPVHCGLGIFEGLGKDPSLHIRLHELGFNKHAPPPGGVNMSVLIDRVQALAAQVSGQTENPSSAWTPG